MAADSGFRELGYLIFAVSEEAERQGRDRVRMQQQAGLAVRWLEPEEAMLANPWLAGNSFRGAS